MKPDLQASLLCDDVRQERNGKFILIGLFDGIGVPSFPSVFQRICIVNRWCCGVGEFSQKSRVVKSDGHTVLAEGKPVAVKLTDDESNSTCVEVFMNIRFDNPGTYWVEILLDDDLRLRYPLKARIVSGPKQKRQEGNGR